MKELQIVTINTSRIGESEVNSVNARDLHAELKLKSDFSSWIKKQLELFIEGVDYITLTKKVERQILKEYILTLDTAKHIAMIQRNEKGRQVRQAFIDYEKNVPVLSYEQVMQQALTMADDKVKALKGANDLLLIKNEKLYNEKEDVIEVMQERDSVIDAMSDRSRKFSIDEWSGMINDKEKIQIGQRRLFKVLRELGYLKNDNAPMQRFRDQGLFDIYLHTFCYPNGEKGVSPKTLVTYKGMDKLTPIVIDYWLDNE